MGCFNRLIKREVVRPPPCAELEDEMTDLTLVASRQATLPLAAWAHGIRNLPPTIGLHLDSLARLSGPQGAWHLTSTASE
jgi:hypothetical protein